MIDAAVHGGDIRGIARTYGRPIGAFIDFSANINPLGPPVAVQTLVAGYASAGLLGHYPEPGLPDLANVLAQTRGVDPENILIHGGSAALFDVILRSCASRGLGLCVPAFAEYARAARANGLDVRAFMLDTRGPHAFDPDRFCRFVRDANVDAVVLNNPHNPLGFALSAAALRDLHERLPEVTLIVDEAFADYDQEVSLASLAAGDGRVIVVRSLTKFYGIPDLRVGYAVMTAAQVERMSPYIPAWPVSGIAAAAAAAAVSDADYATTTLATNALERARLRFGLSALGLRVFPAAANFLTFEAAGAGALRERLIAGHSIVVRECSSFAGLAADRYVRVAVRTAADNAQLLAALGAVRDHQ